jgi:hypothetical protein
MSRSTFGINERVFIILTTYTKYRPVTIGLIQNRRLMQVFEMFDKYNAWFSGIARLAVTPL